MIPALLSLVSRRTNLRSAQCASPYQSTRYHSSGLSPHCTFFPVPAVVDTSAQLRRASPYSCLCAQLPLLFRHLIIFAPPHIASPCSIEETPATPPSERTTPGNFLSYFPIFPTHIALWTWSCSPQPIFLFHLPSPFPPHRRRRVFCRTLVLFPGVVLPHIPLPPTPFQPSIINCSVSFEPSTLTPSAPRVLSSFLREN